MTLRCDWAFGKMNIACCIRDDTVFQNVQAALGRVGIVCECFSTEISLLRNVRRRNFELILIDISGDQLDSESIFSWLNCRSVDSTSVIMLSSTRSADVTALALDAGADDFVAIPFEPVELVARVRALLRRSNRHSVRRTIEVGGYSLDREASRFSYHGVSIELTPREFTMAWLFFSTPGIYISRETIGTAIWGVDSEIAGRTIEQHVYKLRKKLQLGSDRGVMIRTAYSQGYRLELCVQEQNS